MQVTKLLLVAIDLHMEIKTNTMSMATGNCLATGILQKFYFVQQKKETHTDLGQFVGE